MKIPRLKKIVLSAIAIVLLFLVIILATLEQGTFTQFVSSRVIQTAARHDLTLKLVEPELSLGGFSAKRVSLFFQRAFLGLEFSSLRIIPEIGLSPAASLYAQLYGGTGIILGFGGLSGNFRARNTSLTAIQLAQHPQLLGLGVTAGQLDLTLKDFVSVGQRPRGGEFALSLKGLKTSRISLPGLPLPIPPLADLNLRIQGRMAEKQVSLASFELESSYGKVSGDATVTQPWDSGLAMIELNATILFSEQGQRELGDLLPLMTGGRLGPETKTFALNLAGPLNRPRISLNGQPVRLPY